MAKVKKKAKGKVGKPRKVITPEQMRQAEEYAYNNCLNGTIEGLMDWPNEFIVRRADIAKKLTKKRQEGKADLHKAQHEKALKDRDGTMLIWLGKNELGQADKTETKLDAGNAPAVVIIGANTRDGGSAADNND